MHAVGDYGRIFGLGDADLDFFSYTSITITITLLLLFTLLLLLHFYYYYTSIILCSTQHDEATEGTEGPLAVPRLVVGRIQHFFNIRLFSLTASRHAFFFFSLCEISS